MWNEIASLFSGLSLIAMILLLVGLVFFMVEVFVPGIGVFGILGGLFTLGGIITKICLGATFTQIVVMLGFAIVAILVLFVVLTISARVGIIKRSPFVQDKTSVPVNFEKVKEFQKLIGKKGFASSDFNPTGKMSLNEKTYDAISTGEFIEKNSKILVVEVKGDRIYVKKI